MMYTLLARLLLYTFLTHTHMHATYTCHAHMSTICVNVIHTCLAFVNMPRLLSIVLYGVYSITFVQAAAHREDRSDWPGQEMMGHVSREIDPSPSFA